MAPMGLCAPCQTSCPLQSRVPIGALQGVPGERQRDPASPALAGWVDRMPRSLQCGTGTTVRSRGTPSGCHPCLMGWAAQPWNAVLGDRGVVSSHLPEPGPGLRAGGRGMEGSRRKAARG